ncbi:hypothetical protein C2E23DRAFT_256533 [Lenzites betulinus]|nr:hypothetical protein C2E23DRAFT_256533 [Lenzites betulinus]
MSCPYPPFTTLTLSSCCTLGTDSPCRRNTARRAARDPHTVTVLVPTTMMYLRHAFAQWRRAAAGPCPYGCQRWRWRSKWQLTQKVVLLCAPTLTMGRRAVHRPDQPKAMSMPHQHGPGAQAATRAQIRGLWQESEAPQDAHAHLSTSPDVAPSRDRDRFRCARFSRARARTRCLHGVCTLRAASSRRMRRGFFGWQHLTCFSRA